MAEGEKKFVSVGSLKVGGYVLIDNSVCQIKSYDKSKPGKHGSAKARIVAIDVFTGQKKNLLKPTSADAQVPILLKGSAQVVAVMGDIIQIMDMESYETRDVKKPEDLELEAGNEVEYIRWGDYFKITRKKWIKSFFFFQRILFYSFQCTDYFMLLIKVETAQGCLEKNLGCEQAPQAILKQLKLKEITFQEDSIEIIPGNLKQTNQSIQKKALQVFKNAPSNEQIVFLGGDHSISLPIFEAFQQVFPGKKTGLIVFDAHPDCMHYFKPASHEDWLRVLIEDKIIAKENILLIGIQKAHRLEKKFLQEQGLNVLEFSEIKNKEKSLKKLRSFLQNLEAIYLSLDIDVFSPDLAPGTGYREKKGLTATQFFNLMEEILKTKKIQALDLVEVNPEKDVKEKTISMAGEILEKIKEKEWRNFTSFF